MKKLFCVFCVIILMSMSFAYADIKLDYDAMTERDLLLLLSDISDELERFGYTVTITKESESTTTPAPTQTTAPTNSREEDGVVYEYPISIQYASVTNSKGLSSRKDISISFKNTSEKDIRRVFFGVMCFNRVDEHCWGGEASSTGPFEANERYYHISVYPDVLKDSAASRIVLCDIRIVFMDDTEIVIDDPEEIERLYVKK